MLRRLLESTLYAAVGLVWSLIIPLEPWVAQLVRDQRLLPLAARVAYVVLQPAWAPAIACGITLPLLLLPDGRLRSRRWRPVAAAVAGAVLALVAGSLAPEPPEEALFGNPLALGGAAGTVAAVVAWVGVALFLVGLVAAVACVLRSRRSSGTVARADRPVHRGVPRQLPAGLQPRRPHLQRGRPGPDVPGGCTAHH